MGQASSLQAPLEDKIGYKFRNSDLLLEALTHDSLRAGGDGKDYQRMEFLGDAVVHFVITNYIYKKYPAANEGTMTNMRMELVNSKKQREIASELGMEKFIKLHSGVQSFSKIDKFLESVIGAVFLDAGGEDGRGYQAAKDVIWRLWSLG